MIWSSLDTWIVVAGALSAASCALLGCFLLVRRMSMMGDAISHAVLPGLADAGQHRGVREYLADADFDLLRQRNLGGGVEHQHGFAIDVAGILLQGIGGHDGNAAQGGLYAELWREQYGEGPAAVA